MGPGSKLLHFVSLTDIFITLGATIETSSLHVNSNGSTDILIMGSFEEWAPGPINEVYDRPLIINLFVA